MTSRVVPVCYQNTKSRKINSICTNNKAMLIKLATSVVKYAPPHGAYFDVAMATPLVTDLFYAE